jgi:hypothetical protein
LLGLRLGGGSRKPQRPSQSVYKNGWPLLPLLLPKNYADAAMQSLLRTTLESVQNFACTKIFLTAY